MLPLLMKSLIIPQLIKPYHFSNLLFLIWGLVPNGGFLSCSMKWTKYCKLVLLLDSRS